MFYNKYIKYKQKYLKLKKSQEGGKVPCNKGYRNLLGTCWAVAIQMMFTFGKATSEDLEKIMKNLRIGCENVNTSESINCFIERQIQKVRSNHQLNDIFPEIFEANKIQYLEIILKKFIDRYHNKALEIKTSDKQEGMSDFTNPERCELIISQNFKNLFNNPIFTFIKENEHDHRKHGGTILTEYLFSNLLSIFFLEYKVSFKKYDDDLNEIQFDFDNDIGILLITKNHTCCLYFCDTPKYYNDNDQIVRDCDWIQILRNSRKNNLYIETGFNLKQIDNIETYEGNKENLLKVNCLVVVSKFTHYSSLDIDIKNILKLEELGNIKDKDILNQLAIFYMIREPDKAIEIWQKLVDQGYIPANYSLGIMFEIRNPEKAKDFYTITAKHGIAKGQYRLGKMLYYGSGIEQDTIEAIKLLYIAADQGDTDAQIELGKILSLVRSNPKGATADALYEFGRKSYSDSSILHKIEGIRFLRLAVEKGNPNAQSELDKILSLVRDRENPNDATLNALSEFGIRLYSGIDIVQDKIEGIQLIRIAAEQGNANAQFELGKRLYLGIPQDKIEGIRFLSIASEQGNANAQFELGKILSLQRGNLIQATILFRLAAYQGNPNAQYEFGIRLYLGIGIQQDKAEGIKLLQLTADQGNAKAQFHLGRILYRGIDIAQDKAKGTQLIRIAAKKGDVNAQFQLDIIEREEREEREERKEWVYINKE